MGRTGKTKFLLILASLMGLLSWNVTAANWHVATNGNDEADGSTWITAKATIQAAVDASSEGDTVWVSNGVYATGGRVFQGPLTNRVVIEKPITVRSINGPEVTCIEGVQPKGDAAMRCVYLGTNAILSGFTLINGATREWYPSASSMSIGGGGVWCESSGVASNCIITGNQAIWGGGSYGGTLNNCLLSQNAAGSGGGSDNSSLNNSVLVGNTAQGTGGGAEGGTLNHCIVSSNSANYGGGISDSQGLDCQLIGNIAQEGGGVSGAELEQCLILQNIAWAFGGGGSGSTMRNCVVAGNSASIGGGCREGSAYNCTVSGNWANSAGGAYRGKLYNCIVYYNEAALDPNYRDSLLEQSCTTPMPDGVGNITNEPGLASPSHLMPGSPCNGAGSGMYASGADIDGNEWANPPAIGCDEWVAGSVTGVLHVQMHAAYTNVAIGFPVRFRTEITGRETASQWQWGDGAVESNRHYLDHAFSTSGKYSVVFTAYNDSAPLGEAATVTMQVTTQMVHYVALESTNPVPPFSSWANAATNIQDAIDATSQAGALVWVSNGVYSTGSRVVREDLANRVAIDKPIVVRSVNGPTVTIIQGARDSNYSPGGGGPGSVRCAFVGSGAVLSGFSLNQGCTWGWNAGNSCDISGGGAWCDIEGIVDACIIAANNAWIGGGGVLGGILNNCIVLDNQAYDSGGGARHGTLNQCTVVRNASNHGGLSQCSVENSIVCLNGGNYSDSSFHYCATAPAQESNWGRTILDGNENILVDDPRFVDADASDFHLSTNSPCLDRGNNDCVQRETDLDGNPRIACGTVDMGAYEAPSSARYWAWAQGITNSLTNDADCAAGDGVPNLLKYAMGGSPMEPDDEGRIVGTMNEEGFSVVHFMRGRNALDVTIVVQGAAGLTNGIIWENLATNLAGRWIGFGNCSEDETEAGILCHVSDLSPLATNRFMRLKVTRP